MTEPSNVSFCGEKYLIALDMQIPFTICARFYMHFSGGGVIELEICRVCDGDDFLKSFYERWKWRSGSNGVLEVMCTFFVISFEIVSTSNWKRDTGAISSLSVCKNARARDHYSPFTCGEVQLSLPLIATAMTASAVIPSVIKSAPS